MILPTKHLPPDRALLTLGAMILQLLDSPKTVSRLWDELRQSRSRTLEASPITYDWFILALDFLYLVETIELERGRLRKVQR